MSDVADAHIGATVRGTLGEEIVVISSDPHDMAAVVGRIGASVLRGSDLSAVVALELNVDGAGCRLGQAGPTTFSRQKASSASAA